MSKLDSFTNKYYTPKAFKVFVTIFILLSLWAIFCVYPFRFYTAYFVSPSGEIITVSTNEGLDTAPGTYFSGDTFIYDNGNKTMFGAAPHLEHIWEIFSLNFGYNVGLVVSIILKALCLVAAVAGLAFIWMNRPKFTLFAVVPFLLTLLLSYIRVYDYEMSSYEKFWTTPNAYIAVGVTKFSMGIMWTIFVLLIVFSALALLTTKKGNPHPTPVTVANNANNPVPVYTTTPSIDHTEELRNYKKLLDDGVITQEEFDAKKKQLLGL